jgi:hypothetical protein
MADTTAQTDPVVQREGLVDHFKAAYQIVVGIAITIACTNLFADGFIKFPLDVSFWLFAIFFITVMPIFHGGDRSLDVKYLARPATGFSARVSYLWDFYALMITAILFVKIAQAIPGPVVSPVPAVSQGAAASAPAPTPAHFYAWMAIMLAFDVVVLIIDGIKSQLFSAYGKWIALNVALAVVCLWARSQPDWLPPHFSDGATGEIVFVIAFLRTVLDYVFGGTFMFP